jgi:Ca-activated chloride channel family protein
MRIRALFAVLLVCSAAAEAQEPPVFRSNTNLVVVPVTVTDRSGRFARNLGVDQFEILDDGMPSRPAQFSAERVPVSLGILLDISGSMLVDRRARAAFDRRWGDSRRALELLITRLDPRDDVFFAAFNENVGIALPWTSEHPRILPAFDALRPAGRTALFSAVRLISPAFQIARYERKVLLLISDGQDTSVGRMASAPARTKAETFGGLPSSEPVNLQREAAIVTARQAIRESEAALYAIGIGTQSTRRGTLVDVATLGRLTGDSGGYVEPLRESSEIPDAIARICDDLQSQYVLAFEPRHADGKYHPIAVKTKNTRLKVRARTGYVAQSLIPNP